MRTRIILTILLLLVARVTKSQSQWHEGIVNTDNGIFECSFHRYRIRVNMICTDKRVDLPMLPFDLDEDPRKEVDITINSERHLYNAVTAAISKEKFMTMIETKEFFSLSFDLTETGEILRIKFSLDKETLITPDEVAIMDSLIRKNLRFKVVKNFDYREPHRNISAFYINPKEVLNGEIVPAKRNEMRGKQYWK